MVKNSYKTKNSFLKYPVLFRVFLIFLIFFSLGIKNHKVNSQVSFNQNDVSMQINPEFPEPEEEVSVTLSSYAIDLSRSSIRWEINGEVVESGIDKKSYSFQSPKAGDTLVLRVFIYLQDGTVLEKNSTISPGTLDLFWEVTNAYTPPFYKGKTFPTPESTIRVVSVPDVPNNNDKNPYANMVYSWERGYKNESSASGYGKNSFLFSNSYTATTENISVTTSSLDGASFNAQRSIAIEMISPFILLYQEHPENGVLYEKSFTSDRNIIDDNIVLKAEPYFFSVNNPNSEDLDYSWIVGGFLENSREKISISNNEEDVPISVTVESFPKLFQEADFSTIIPFR